MHPITLSEKAWKFVESRHSGTIIDEYVSRLIENVADLSSDSSFLADGTKLIEVIEAYKPLCNPSCGKSDEVATHIIYYLREAYHGKVPRAIFQKKCFERGMSHEDITLAEKAFWQWLM